MLSRRLPSAGPLGGFLSSVPPLGRAGLSVLLGAMPWKAPGYWGGQSCPLVARRSSRAGRKPYGCDAEPCQWPSRCWAPGCILPTPVSPLPLSLHWHSQCQDVSHAGHCWEHSAPGESVGQTGRRMDNMYGALIKLRHLVSVIHLCKRFNEHPSEAAAVITPNSEVKTVRFGEVGDSCVL